jgi:hypothetical protein
MVKTDEKNSRFIRLTSTLLYLAKAFLESLDFQSECSNTFVELVEGFAIAFVDGLRARLRLHRVILRGIFSYKKEPVYQF